MTFVVTEPCIACKYTDCVVVCPMDCFFEGPNFIAIHPDECIDCSMCVAECPVGAIVGDRELPPEQQHFLALNRELVEQPGWQRLTARKEPLPDHAQWAAVADKFDELKR
ncbi:ferredoxin FdxA [Oxalicibacterium solurbis]|uniref:Ferredoxin n=1 Tax=Oxalicibacterium solurbis TaxID=69280 RepID=A0A8J3AYB7_9BURK|nr:ferredoxin FdxA [Oxalicibacterium solurbis]GGI53277.1 ferredoxin [Oxalicibacterium solurbis]